MHTAEQKKKRNIIIGVGFFIVIAGIIIYFYVTHKASNPAINNLSGAPPSGGTPSTYSDPVDPNKVLHKGDSGASVVQLQKEINKKLPPVSTMLITDGVFGPATDSALKIVSNNVLSSVANNATINAVMALGGNSSTISPPPSGSTGQQKMYALIPLTPVYDNISDWYPARYAGYNEYLGLFSSYQYTYLGSKYAVTDSGRAIDATYVHLV